MENKKDSQMEDIRFAVFDGGKEITPQMYEEVKNFAAYIKTDKK